MDSVEADIEQLLCILEQPGLDSERQRDAVRQLRQQLTQRRHAARQHAQLQEELLATIEQVNEGFAVFDRHWRFAYVNAQAARLLGKPREQLLGRTPWEAIPETGPDSYLSHFQRAIEENVPVRCEVFCTVSNAWHECRCYPAADGAVVFLCDITARKKAQQALQESEEHFRLLVEGVSEWALFLLDPRGCIMDWNTGAQRIKGYKAHEILGKHVSICYTPEDNQAGKPQRDLDIAAQQGCWAWEGWVVRKDASRFWAEVSLTALYDDEGVLRGFAELARDVTERMRSQELLRHANRRFQALLDNVQLVAVGLDRNGHIDYANPYFLELTGYSWEDVKGKSWLTSFIPERCRPEVQQVFTALLEKRVHRHYENPILTKTGQERLLAWNNTPFLAPDGKPIGTMSIAEDVTERRRAEEALKQAEIEMRQAKDAAEQAARSKDQFIAILSHELRTPLTPVLTMVQMLERDASLSTEQHESMQMVERNVALETRLIDDLLDVTRISRGKLELHLAPVDLHSLLRHTLAICESDLRAKQLTITADLAAPHHHAHGDPARLQQVFWNLLKNAIKFTPHGGTITLRTAQPPDQLLVTISLQDTGIGIAPEMLPQIFNPFEQGSHGVTRLFGGLGLGLSIAKGLIELHGGSLTATSPGQNQGATFAATLPASLAAETAPTHPGSWTSASPTLKGGRILLVEDNADTITVMSKLLKSYGYDVRVADSVAAALRIAAAEQFDLMLCDIGLPDGNGLDLMRQLSHQHPLKAIALSGYGMEEDVKRSQAAGFLAHLTKPVDVDTLEAALDRVLATT